MIHSLKARVARSFLCASPRLLGRLAAPVVVDGQTLEPALALLCRYLDRAGGLEELSPPAARRRMTRLSGLLKAPRSPAISAEDRVLGEGGPTGRIYTPPSLRDGAPLVVYFHGGGWVLGDLDSHDGLCGVIAEHLGARVVAVDYRLAPEHRFPAALDDAEAAFRWAAEEAAGEAGRVVLAGDSAGGNLAAVVSARAVASDGPRPAAQLLIYPVTDSRRDTRSYELFARGYGLSRALMDWFFGHYCPADDHLSDPRLAPLQAASFQGLPPTVLSLAGFDVLRDEGLAYAEALRHAGVQVICRLHENLIHSFANMTTLPFCRGPLEQALDDLQELIG